MLNKKKKIIDDNVPKILTSSQDFDDFAKNLQNFIDDEEEALYSETVRKEYRSPVNLGIISNSSGKARWTGPCGDTMEFHLTIKDHSITDIKFQTNGCGITVAAGSMLTKMVEGKTIKDALKIEPEDLTNALNGLPPENIHCSLLAVTTLRMAISNYIEKTGKDPKSNTAYFKDIIP